MPQRLDAAAAGFPEAFAALLADKREISDDVDAAVSAILRDVMARGDDAVLAYTRRFDRVTATAMSDLRVTPAEIDAAFSACRLADLAALDLAAGRIEAYHRRQLPDGFDEIDGAGVRLGMRWSPVASAGLYVPGGIASYPSSVLMNAIPARVAGVKRVAMAVPAPDGALNPLVLAAARRVGITEIWRIGGAQAVAAFAYGTRSILPVDKIVGPGNAYVAAAKRQVFGRVGIDAIAGPSEILVIADKDNDPSWIAADLLSQAEHDQAAQAILITDDAGFADAVAAAVQDHLQTLPRSAIAAESWQRHGAIVVVPDLDAALPLAERIAPEHLELAIADPDRLAGQIHAAGAIFLGRYTPEAIGDYVAGSNHVLPTARTARFSSGLGVHDFMKRTALIGCDRNALAAIGPAAITLAQAEGLEAHALSVRIRLPKSKKNC